MDNFITYSQQVLDSIESGKIEEANRLFGWALRKDDDETLYNLAGEIFALGFDNKALRIYNKLLKEFPNDDDLKVLKAEVLIDQDKNDEAINILNSVLPESDEYVSALLVLADLYQTEELFEVAESKLVEAYRIDPEEPVIIFGLAEIYNMTQDYEKANSFYLALIKMGIPEFAQTNIVERLAVSYAAMGKFETAIAYFEQIHDSQLTPEILLQQGLTYLQLNEDLRAQESFEKARDMDASFESIYPYLAQSYADSERWEDALKAAQEGLAVDQFNPSLYLIAANMAEHIRDDSQVEQFLKDGVTSNPENVELLIRYTSFLNRLGHYSESIKLLLNNDLHDAQLSWNLANAYRFTDQFKLAIEPYQEAYLQLSDNPEFLKDYYQFLKSDGKVSESIEILNRYLSIVPDDLDMQFELDNLEG